MPQLPHDQDVGSEVGVGVGPGPGLPQAIPPCTGAMESGFQDKKVPPAHRMVVGPGPEWQTSGEAAVLLIEG